MPMRMKKLRDDDDTVLWLSPKQNNGDWDYWYAIKLEYMEAHGNEVLRDLGRYVVTLIAVSPEAAQDVIPDAKGSCGWEGMPNTPEVMAELLIDYGAYAKLGEWHGNNRQKLLSSARHKLHEACILFGFVMDRQQNAIGATGWDTIAGRYVPE